MTIQNDWGGDTADLTDGDIDPSGRDLDGLDVECVKQALYRRFTTETGGLFYDASFGFNIRALLSDTSTVSGRSTMQTQLVAQALLDERIDSATCAIVYNASSKSAVIRLDLVSGIGPFSLVLSIDQVSVTILNEQAS